MNLTKDDKAICKMTADYLTRAMDSIQELSPAGRHELAAAILDKDLPTIQDLNSLVKTMKRLSKSA